MRAAQPTLLVCLLAVAAGKLPLPPYLTKCPSAERSKLNECGLQNARNFIAAVSKTGDRKYGIPVIDPAFIPRVIVEQNGIKMEFINITLEAFPFYSIYSIDMDLEKRHLNIALGAPRTVFKSLYRVDGRILLLLVKGNGDCEMTFENYTAIYDVDFDLVKNTNDNEDYVKFKNVHYRGNTDRAYYQFNNLFNGDSTLGKVTNDFLNENWKVVFEETSPSTVKAIGLYINSVMQNVFDKVPYRDGFPV